MADRKEHQFDFNKILNSPRLFPKKYFHLLFFTTFLFLSTFVSLEYCNNSFLNENLEYFSLFWVVLALIYFLFYFYSVLSITTLNYSTVKHNNLLTCSLDKDSYQIKSVNEDGLNLSVNIQLQSRIIRTQHNFKTIDEINSFKSNLGNNMIDLTLVYFLSRFKKKAVIIGSYFNNTLFTFYEEYNLYYFLLSYAFLFLGGVLFSDYLNVYYLNIFIKQIVPYIYLYGFMILCFSMGRKNTYLALEKYILTHLKCEIKDKS